MLMINSDGGKKPYDGGKKIDGSWFKPYSAPVNKPKQSYSYREPSYAEPYYDPMQAYLEALEAQRRAQIEAKRKVIEQQLQMGLNEIDSEMSKVPDAYQPLKNQSEVNRFTAQRNLRENQANRGALDSGAGRQETLALQNNYGNNLSQIALQEQAEIDEYNRQKTNLKSQAEIQKGQVENDLSADLASYLGQINVSQFANQARNNASNIVQRSAANMPQKKVAEGISSFKPATSSVLDKYFAATKKSPINRMSAYVTDQLNKGLITIEDANKMLKGY